MSHGTLYGNGNPPSEVSGFYKLKEAPWTLVMIAPGREILYPIAQFRLYYFIIGTGFILLILLLIKSVMGRTVVPIKEVCQAAERIAQHFSARVEKEGCYLGDDYRWKNPISSAWVVMSLLDFYQINQDDYYKNMILKCGGELLKRQAEDVNHPVYHGSWYRAYSTSGNGWLAEVMMEMYRFCQEQNIDGCDKYKEAIIRVRMLPCSSASRSG